MLTKDQALRILSKVHIRTDPSACWTWLGSKTPSGYGQMMVGSKNCRAHRLVYEILEAPIPLGLVLDHLCLNPSCVNPRHLEPVTIGENVRRGAHTVCGINARKTHCKRGHEFTPENTFRLRVTARNPGGGRMCRACKAAKDLVYSKRLADRRTASGLRKRPYAPRRRG